ncbi:TetR/AcrR family transcriptional regulator [Halomonas faecis]|uniref:TetR/AcrR family transcriptional regulator n=1 Tax=Halomonas faecis TaxID=1562110 RepID=UPI0013D2FC40|nr:TetR/AcrR family transcriptional regulator [Halomonas faecis]
MTRGRPLAFDPDRAINAAMETFWSHGYQATSMRELLDAMAISRSSLYQAFGSKEQLFLEALRRYRDGLMSRLHRQLDTAPSGLAFVEGLFRETGACAGTERAALGCLIFNSASELGQREGLPSQHAAQSVAAITELFYQAVSRAQAEGDVAADRDARALAHYLTLGMAGLRTLLKSGIDPAQAEQTVELLLQTLRQ